MSEWLEGYPPDSVDVAWLAVFYSGPDDDVTSVTLGMRDDNGAFVTCADWSAESYCDDIDGVITHWMPYHIPKPPKGAK